MLLDSFFILGFSLFNHFSLSLYRERSKAADTCMLCMKERTLAHMNWPQLLASKDESKLCRLHLNPWNKIMAKSLELMCSKFWAL
ncbi:unnamed protein product [Arabidopsis thaliana]|uniref:Uncharacterized protein n=3 Tax=Arabidopsis TaxID=3701 RepID=A0A654G092_ARATH|nr:uncharacterized protein AT5G10946 [Arabidopsis thaliana]ANM69852.1 hypothetical protein AT5G10946 [Arabidopsis thaliana]KAG7608821.1 hypothetical protein ISN44_As05g009980 [Arabidopsis suecica]VYS66487.1 unnamed protein product [Arabidopsis thaliana]|eukprot:NP_001331500.1 hypothetical protein AT5G10946 [Arabidopsis thaliana]